MEIIVFGIVLGIIFILLGIGDLNTRPFDSWP